MIYILIIITRVYGGNVTNSIEFSSELKCEQAKQVLAKDGWTSSYSTWTYCVPK